MVYGFKWPPAVGGSFLVECYVYHPSGLDVQWLKRNTSRGSPTVVARANSERCHDPNNPRYSWSSCNLPSNSQKMYNLQIDNAKLSDAGYWICKDTGLNDEGKELEVNILGEIR